MDDALSEVLRAVRLTGAIYFSVDARAPWVAEAAPARQVGRHVLGDAEHVLEYHVVVAGECWAGLLDEPPRRVEAGDVIAFPQGDGHVLSSEPGMRGGPSVDEWLAHRIPDRVVVGRDGARAEIICGFLGCDARPFNPFLSTLPRVLHLRADDGGGTTRRMLVEMALAESRTGRSGGREVLSRVSELLFIEVIRRHAETVPAEQGGWLAGLRDPVVGRALERMHLRPAHAWSLDELAREVGASRTVLAERFTELVGVPPIQYLAQWRIQLAAGHLRAGNASLAEVAERVGYGSETALGRAFKRLTGASPAAYRRRFHAA